MLCGRQDVFRFFFELTTTAMASCKSVSISINININRGISCHYSRAQDMNLCKPGLGASHQGPRVPFRLLKCRVPLQCLQLLSMRAARGNTELTTSQLTRNVIQEQLCCVRAPQSFYFHHLRPITQGGDENHI